MPMDTSIEPESEVRRPCSNASSTDPDTMYHHEAMREPDRVEFLKVMEKEGNLHTTNKNWSIVKRSHLPPEQMVMLAVWATKRKSRISENMYISGRHASTLMVVNTKDMSYWETYAPVVTWSSI
jgi:hypothetical protein